MVVTRFAPSPTGFLHVGSLRTALYSYALAKKYKGKFILRIEDTDKKREIPGAIDGIINVLNTFGIQYDEGPGKKGPHSPYIQSQRLSLYKEKAEELIEKGSAYYCFCSPQRLEKMRKEQMQKKQQPMYDKKCRSISLDEARERIQEGEKFVVRLKVPSGRKIVIDDRIFGKTTWDSDTVDDQVLLKSDGYPTYHLAVVVDDVLMGITHITRGMEWFSSVPKHVLLFEAFQYKIPVMAHLPLILDPAGGKLSKRKGNVSTEQFLEEGYLPEALLNFIMLLGWAPKDDREFYSLKEFIAEFNLDRLNKSNPVFNREKLSWFNGEYLRKVTLTVFKEKVVAWIRTYKQKDKIGMKILKDDNILPKLELIQKRISLLSEVLSSLAFFYMKLPLFDIRKVRGVSKYPHQDYQKAIQKYREVVDTYSSQSSGWKHEVWEKDIRALADQLDWKHGDMFMLIRLAMCSSPYSPPLFESMVILGKKEILERLAAWDTH